MRALRDGRAAIIYWEPQGSLTLWHKLRSQRGDPFLHTTKGDLAKDVRELKATGYQTIIIDTPPMGMEPIERAIAAADVVVIPTRVGLFDIAGIRPVIGMCQKHDRPFLFVLTGINDDAPGWAKLIRDAVKVLKKHGTVAAKAIRERAAYIAALNTGRTGPEIDTDAAKEIQSLWLAIKKQAGEQ